MNQLHPQCLTAEASKTLAFVCTSVLLLHYGNSLLSSCPLYILNTLQKVRNSAVKLHGFQKEYTTNCQLSVNNFSDSFYIPSRQLCSSADSGYFTNHIPHAKIKTFSQCFSSYCALKHLSHSFFTCFQNCFCSWEIQHLTIFSSSSQVYVFIHTD